MLLWKEYDLIFRLYELGVGYGLHGGLERAFYT